MTTRQGSLELAISKAWYRGAFWLWLLWPLSLLTRLVVAWRRWRWQQWPPAPALVPVVVVGGLTVGGSGKTPVLLALVSALMNEGLRVGIVSRGYGSQAARGPARCVTDSDTPETVGDEPMLMHRRAGVPVCVGRDRAQAVTTLLEQHELDVVLSDDGLQHYPMARSFEITVLDGDRGLGNRQLLPMGPLREPVSRLDSVDWRLVRNGSDDSSTFSYQTLGFHPLQPTVADEGLSVEAARERWAPLRVAAVTGIGQPEQFFKQLEALGINCSPWPFPDHYAFNGDELQQIDADIIIVTEKDAVKLRSSHDPRIWQCRIHAELPSALVDALVAHIREGV